MGRMHFICAGNNCLDNISKLDYFQACAHCISPQAIKRKELL